MQPYRRIATRWADRNIGSCWIAAIALLWIALSSCSDLSGVGSVHAPTEPRRSIQLTDWYSCWKFQGDASWRSCEYTGTSGIDNAASWADFINPVYYSSLQQVAVTQHINTVDPAPQAYAVPFGDDDAVEVDFPDCNDPSLTGIFAAYCKGQDPAAFTGDTHRLKVIKAALDRMAALGSPCDSLASDMTAVLDSHHMRIYDIQHDPAQTGVPLKGAFSTPSQHENGWVILDASWTDTFFDQYKYVISWTTVNGIQTRVKANLQTSLAHEADHLHSGPAHLDPTSLGGKGWLTPNSVKCGGLDP